MTSLHPLFDATNVYVPKSSSPKGVILLVNVLPIDTPSLKTSVVMGSVELTSEQDNDKFATLDDGSVTFCPHATDTKCGVIIGGLVGGNISVSFMMPIKYDSTTIAD